MLKIFQKEFSVISRGRGTKEITRQLADILGESGLTNGQLTVFCRHTSCSLVLMENADPTARQDLEMFFEKLVPDNFPGFVHTYEGPDDMPSHIKMALTRTSEVIPFTSGKLCLGTWQGVFLWEHRDAQHTRRLVVSIIGE